MGKIVPQDNEKVKCALEWCEEDIFREGLCWDHFIAEETADWDAQDAEREACWAGVGR